MPGAAKAWVNFNGTGTVAIRASFNVSSITDNGVGDYTVNFTTALADANYAVSGLCNDDATNPKFVSFVANPTKTTTAFRFYTVRNTAILTDSTDVSMSIFR